jgi:hypothetical protein
MPTYPEWQRGQSNRGQALAAVHEANQDPGGLRSRSIRHFTGLGAFDNRLPSGHPASTRPAGHGSRPGWLCWSRGRGCASVGTLPSGYPGCQGTWGLLRSPRGDCTPRRTRDLAAKMVRGKLPRTGARRRHSLVQSTTCQRTPGALRGGHEGWGDQSISWSISGVSQLRQQPQHRQGREEVLRNIRLGR